MLGSNQLHAEETQRERVSLWDWFALRTANLWRIGLTYTLLWVALLLWAGLAPGSFWFASNSAASPASQLMCACAILTSLFIPFVVYFPVTQNEGQTDSSTPTQLWFSRSNKYWKQVAACWLLTLISLLSVYVLFALMNLLGFLTKDLVAPIMLGLTFLMFVAFLTLLTSTTAIGFAMSGSRTLHLVATTIALATVILPFILSELVTGTRFESHLVSFVLRLGQSPAILIVPLLSSLLLGSVFSWHYRHKKS
ncbi:MAG: hypothetical protein ND895_18375 [Pyrinomonadaceae bacterium]|nr:hypothetical protein [Pyrinomonadaceae bacterium]